MKTKCLLFLMAVLFVLTLFFVGITTTNAATKEEIENAIVKGLAWLANQQQPATQTQPDGFWQYDPLPNIRFNVGVTGLVVLKFVERAKELGKDPFNPGEYQYAENVIKGFNYIFTYMISDPNGVHFAFSGADVYDTGIAMMPLAASNAPNRVISTGALSGWTYQQALQGMMNWMAYAQNTGGCEIGGWGYNGPDPGSSDNSNSGYASLGIGYAAAPPPKGFGLTIPPTILSGLSTFIDNLQVDTGPDAGGSIYNPCFETDRAWVNILKTGNLIYELALVGEDTGDTRVQNAISYIENHWNDTGRVPEGSPTSYGWKDSYQAMFTMMKGFETLGIKTITVGGFENDWFDEVSNVIVANQDVDGSWKYIDPAIGEGEFAPNLRAAWALLTLERVVPKVVRPVLIDIKPGSCPNPLNVKSKGVLPVEVLGTGEFDVTKVDPATIKLSREGIEEGVAPLRWNYEDVATPFEGELCGCHALYGDGYMDLSLKFDTQALVGTLKLKDVIGNTLPLTLTGNLKEEFGGMPIKGQDCIWVLK